MIQPYETLDHKYISAIPKSKWKLGGFSQFRLVTGQADRERELRLLALAALHGGAAAGAEGADGVGLLWAGHRHHALGQRAVEVAASRLSRRTRRDPAVALC